MSFFPFILGEWLGIGDIFKKEEKLLDTPKELPDLASEKLGDETSSQFIHKQLPETPIPDAKELPVEPIQKTVQAEPVQQPTQHQQQNVQPQQLMHNQGMHPYNYPYPNMMPAQYPLYAQYPINPGMQGQMGYPGMVPNHPNFIQSAREEIKKSHRTPLKSLLNELDTMEDKWHSLTNDKRNVEKELKYLEAEIEHKLRLLRSHMVIANEDSEVPRGKEFFLADGKLLKSRKDLAFAAEEMSQQIFDHHVGPGWNDFSQWAHNCLKEPELAQRLKKIRSPQELIAALKKY